MDFLNKIKEKLEANGIKDIEIVLINNYEKKGFAFVIFLYDGTNRLRLFHSGLELYSDADSIIERCKYNILKESLRLRKLIQ